MNGTKGGWRSTHCFLILFLFHKWTWCNIHPKIPRGFYFLPLKSPLKLVALVLWAGQRNLKPAEKDGVSPRPEFLRTRFARPCRRKPPPSRLTRRPAFSHDVKVQRQWDGSQFPGNLEPALPTFFVPWQLSVMLILTTDITWVCLPCGSIGCLSYNRRMPGCPQH